MSKSKPADWLAEIQARQQRERDRLPPAKAALLAGLKASRVATVTIEYDGEGDSGQIETIVARTARGKPATLRGSVTLDLHGQAREYKSLEEVLDEFAWAILRVYHDGFENNEGGFGTLTIDVAKGTITLDHNDRIIEVSNTETEL